MDDIVKLIAETGEELEFVVIAGISLDGEYYAILKSVKLPKGMGENEALVFKVARPKGATDDRFYPVNDRELIDEVFAEYRKLLNK